MKHGVFFFVCVISYKCGIMVLHRGNTSIDLGGEMRTYNRKKVEDIIRYAKEVAPYFGIIECRKIIFLAEYLGSITNIPVGILKIKIDNKITIVKFVEAFNQQHLNGIPLSYAIQTENDISICKKSPIVASTVKKWLQEIEDVKSVNDCLNVVDRITLFLMKNPIIPKEIRFDSSFNRKGNKYWTAYCLRGYYKTKNDEVAITTCTTAMRRVYLTQPRVSLPKKEESILALQLKEVLNDEAALYAWSGNYNIQDIINTVSRGDFLEERIMVLTWWWSEDDAKRKNFASWSYKKIRFKYVVSGLRGSTYEDYIDMDPMECFDKTYKFTKLLLSQIGLKILDCDKIIINRRDFLAPYMVYNIGKISESIYRKIYLIDLR